MHAGNDLQAANGSKAVAVIGGTVIYAGNNTGYQWNTVILGDDGTAYRYATHGPLSVSLGDRVEQGQPVGTIARSHLHLEVIPNTSPAYETMVANPGQFVSTQWWPGGQPVTVDPASYFGVARGMTIAAGTPIGDPSLRTFVPEVPDDPFGVGRSREAAQPASLNAPAVGGSLAPTAPSADADLLARVMLSEARGEGEKGMLAVGQVAMNRIRDTSGRFGDTLTDVLTTGEFAKPADVDPNSPEYQTAVAMAGAIIDGVAPNPIGGAVYFMNPDTSTSSGARKIRASGPHLSTIGNHEFYGGGVFAGDPNAPVPDDPAMIRQRLANRDAGVAFQGPPAAVADQSPVEYAAASLPDETFVPRIEGTATTGAGREAAAFGKLPFLPPPGANRGPSPSLGLDPGPIDLSNLLASVSTGGPPGASAEVRINPTPPPSSRPAVIFAPPPARSGLAELATGSPTDTRTGPARDYSTMLASAAYGTPNYNEMAMTPSETQFTPLAGETAETPIQEDRATRVPFTPPPTVSPWLSTVTPPADPVIEIQEDRATRAGLPPAVTPPAPAPSVVAPPPAEAVAPTPVSAAAKPPSSWLSGIADKAQQYVTALTGGSGGIGWAWTPTVQGTSPGGINYTAGPGARGGWTTQWTTSTGGTITTRENPYTGQMETVYG